MYLIFKIYETMSTFSRKMPLNNLTSSKYLLKRVISISYEISENITKELKLNYYCTDVFLHNLQLHENYKLRVLF